MTTDAHPKLDSVHLKATPDLTTPKFSPEFRKWVAEVVIEISRAIGEPEDSKTILVSSQSGTVRYRIKTQTGAAAPCS
jgi:hypothetical protein